MARDADGDRIRGAGLSHRPGGPGAADAGRDLRVGGGGAGRDPRERLPDPALERGALDVERQGGPASPGFIQQGQNHGHGPPQFRIGAPELGLRESGPQTLFQGLSRGAEFDRADPPPGRRNQDGPEIGPDDRETDALPRRAAPVLRRPHAQGRRRAFVEPAARGESRIVKRRGDAAPVPQARP